MSSWYYDKKVEHTFSGKKPKVGLSLKGDSLSWVRKLQTVILLPPILSLAVVSLAGAASCSPRFELVASGVGALLSVFLTSSIGTNSDQTWLKKHWLRPCYRNFSLCKLSKVEPWKSQAFSGHVTGGSFQLYFIVL